MPNIRFGDIDFSSDGAYVWGAGQYSAPARSVDFIEVPGRNGDLLIDNGNYTNTTAIFDVIITEDIEENTNRLKYLLYSQKGYQKLYDSDLKGFYRMASFNSGFEILSTEGGVVRIEFDCKPFKYDIAGDEPIILQYSDDKPSGSFYLENPYFEESKPAIRVYADLGYNEESSITINEKSIYFLDRPNNWFGALIDTDMQFVYREMADRNENLNRYVSSVDLSLKAGVNKISFGGAIKKLEVYPRWVTL